MHGAAGTKILCGLSELRDSIIANLYAWQPIVLPSPVVVSQESTGTPGRVCYGSHVMTCSPDVIPDA